MSSLGPLLLPLLVHLASRAPKVAAQGGTSAVCNAGFDWMSNSKGQSPCLVSSWLFTPCSTAAASYVYPLAPTYHYNTPQNSSTSATPCRCNTVLFSTIAACATCQGQENYITPWSEYKENCSTVYIQKYPEDIPADTAVPAWAYLDITQVNTFDPAAAQALANQGAPESTATVTPSSTATSNTATPTSSDSSQGAPKSGNGDTSGGSKKSISIGPIVGGVVGGVVALIAIGLAVFFFLRHRRSKAKHTVPTGPLDSTTGGAQYAQYTQYPQYGEAPYGETSPTQEVIQPLISAPSPRLYDPNDPTTFPNVDNYTGSVQASGHSAEHPGSHGLTASTHQPSLAMNQHSTYKGVPEL
ncbi:hypothetical protein C8Q80DRAFT_1119204 [Daedaleopsis nitida]|nr:hypothetical protein C8Q80DRAFT_1119204 [Daedaleopsis nitida]